ncbi:SUMF1/EgtB/PvdO family nonheme iron enzyme [Engelhardtia mirabilis]|uniref:Serine/threonine-protein kinase pkn1 n=1 Tax=Engelhardtia mirabilis TaxID=2528011 RepID=A0A518BRF0_9BACT|nr:Serine/threonine-protein kinase pkn1 [Planctomycetes bacterium Pla133]QDV03863.1 Serine/threonine-protein kinase pkn1 [Planctomycetes bacterium Pla86]
MTKGTDQEGDAEEPGRALSAPGLLDVLGWIHKHQPDLVLEHLVAGDTKPSRIDPAQWFDRMESAHRPAWDPQRGRASIEALDAALRSVAANGQAMAPSNGTYRLRQVLGRGGQGTVIGVHPAWVLKLIEPLRSLPREISIAEAHEGRVAAGVAEVKTSLNLVVRGKEYFALLVERLRAKLADRLDEEGWSLEQRLTALVEVVEAVQGLHRSPDQLCHLDLKPANIGQNYAGDWKLFDLGSALSAGTGEEKLHRSAGFSAPEQEIDGAIVDPRMDVFSLGAIAYWILTRRSFWPGGDDRYFEWLQGSHAQRLGEFGAECRRAFPNVTTALVDSFESIVRRAASLDSGGRYPTARDMLDDVKHARELFRTLSRTEQHQVQGRLAPSETDSIRGYRRSAQAKYAQLRLLGIPRANELTVRPALEDFYVPLTARPDVEALVERGVRGAAMGRKLATSAVEGGEAFDLVTLFRRAAERGGRRGALLLGDPGMGKTTHLLHLLLWLLGDNDPTDLGLPSDVLPVFVPLKDCAHTTQGLSDLLEVTFATELPADRFPQMPAGLGAELARRGNLLVLLDGLDEVRDPVQRQAVGRWITGLAEDNATCRFVATCRVAGFTDELRRESQLETQFFVASLTPLSDERRERFVRNWYRVAALDRGLPEDTFAGEADDLVATVGPTASDRSARIAELTRTPLLLAALCVVHTLEQDLPNRRAELYGACVEALLHEWQGAKGLEVGFEPGVARRILARIAHWMHSAQGRDRISRAELIEALESGALVLPDGTAGPDPRATLGAFLDRVVDESGLLVGWSQDRIGFAHLAFQEYLTSFDLRVEFVEQRSFAVPERGTLAPLAGRAGDPWWQEVLLCFASPLARPWAETCQTDDLFERLFGAIVESPLVPTGVTRSTADQRRTVRDARRQWLDLAIADRGGCPAEPLLGLLERAAGADEDLWLRQLSALQLMRAHHRDRLDARLLARLAEHPLAEIARLTSDRPTSDATHRSTRPALQGGYELVPIPGGTFTMGDPDGHGDEQPNHPVNVSPFLLGRFPVTNADYALFLEATGHREPDSWGDREFNSPQQPVVGVSWDDAQEYCAWAGLRLPTEAEWEYACRAGTTTSYWSGSDEPDLARVGWYDANSGGRTQAVGQLPANAFGLHDVHGNVFEWVEDSWSSNYSDSQVAHREGRPFVDDGSGYRVMRGGSFANTAGYARCGYRFRGPRSVRFRYFGFRAAQDITA